MVQVTKHSVVRVVSVDVIARASEIVRRQFQASERAFAVHEIGRQIGSGLKEDTVMDERGRVTRYTLFTVDGADAEAASTVPNGDIILALMLDASRLPIHQRDCVQDFLRAYLNANSSRNAA